MPGHTVRPDGSCSCNNPECENIGKHPRVRWAEYQTRLPTETEWTRWAAIWPVSNILGATGALSGFVAVDVDPRHGGDEAWREWTRRNPVHETPESLTGGGGRHLLFLHPGEPVKNAANLLPGVDFRGDGGYIVLPPSRHASGRTYEWDASLHPDDLPLAPMPPALLALVRRGGGQESDEPRRPLDIEGLIDGTATIAEGERNVTLTRVAGYLAGSSESLDELVQVVGRVNDRCRPGLEPAELRKICASIWRREQGKKQAEEVLLESSDAIWHALGVPVVSDWYQLQGDRFEYVLATPEDEVRFGSLLDPDTLRTLMHQRLGIVIPIARRGTFDRQAKVLHDAARKVIVEPLTAEERVAEWVDSWTQVYPPEEAPE